MGIYIVASINLAGRHSSSRPPAPEAAVFKTAYWPYEMAKSKRDVIITSGQYVPDVPGIVSPESRARANRAILTFVEVLQSGTVWNNGTKQVQGQAHASFRGKGTVISHYLKQFQTECASLFQELEQKSGIRPEAGKWNWRKVRVSLRHPQFDDMLVVHEALIFPDGKCKYVFMLVGDHDDYDWHLDFDAKRAQRHIHMGDGEGVPVITAWSVNAMENDRLRVPILDDVMEHAKIADDYQFKEGDQFGRPQERNFEDVENPNLWYRLGSTRVGSDGSLQWQVTAVKSGDSWTMTEAELRALLNENDLMQYGALNLSQRKVITENPLHAGTPVMLGKKELPASSKVGKRSIRVPGVAGEPHTKQDAGRITTVFNTIHSNPPIGLIGKNVIRIVVSTEIGAGRTHVGLAAPAGIMHNLTIKF